MKLEIYFREVKIDFKFFKEVKIEGINCNFTILCGAKVTLDTMIKV